ncbi:MAG TPA: PQQ-binding-like beta-propeller repeat protein [Kofleriaceae bacterium]|jgi:polyvinyl alcohol dehydrogenase (cytochrome)
MYGRNLHHPFSASDSAITAANVNALAPAWTFTPGDAVSASPAVADGVVYVGSWDGFFYAIDARNGALRWKFQLDCDALSLPQPAVCVAQGYAASDPAARQGTDGGTVTSSAAVVDGVVYFGGEKTLYALRASDGHLLWKRVLCGNPDERDCERDAADPVRIFSSPVVYHGHVYVGSDVDGAVGYRGRIWALDARDGRTAWAFEVDPQTDSAGNPVRGPAQNRGCGNVWTSAAIDEDRDRVIFGTADCQSFATTPYHNAMLAFDADTGALAWKFRPIPAANGCDFDFGASPNVIDFGGQRFIGEGNKNGTYYLLHADGALAWSTNVVYGGADGGFIGSTAYDDGAVFGGTMYGDGYLGAIPVCDPSNPRDTYLQDPSMHAFDLRTGAVLWEQSGSYAAAATTVTHDLVIDGTMGLGAELAAAVQFFDRRTGAILRQLPQAGSVASATVIVGDTIYFGTGNSYDGGGSSIQAWRLGR